MTVLGFIEGIAEAIVSVMKGVSGWSSDRLGRRVPYILRGYGMAAVSKPILALAFSWPLVFFTRSLDRLGKGLRSTARDALITDAVDSSQGGKAYGFHRMMDTSGAVVGVLIATDLLALLPGQYRTIFLVAAVPGLLAVRLTFRLRDVALPTQDEGVTLRPCPSTGGKPWSGLPTSLLKNPRWLRCCENLKPSRMPNTIRA